MHTTTEPRRVALPGGAVLEIAVVAAGDGYAVAIDSHNDNVTLDLINLSAVGWLSATSWGVEIDHLVESFAGVATLAASLATSADEGTHVGPAPLAPLEGRVMLALADRGDEPTTRPPWARPPTFAASSGTACCGCRKVGTCMVFYGDHYRAADAGDPQPAFFAFCLVCVAELAAAAVAR